MKFTLVIRFTNSESGSTQVNDLTIPLGINFGKDDVNKLVTTNWIKSTIRTKVSQCRENRLRLIYNGRVLNENTDFKQEVFISRLHQDQANTTETTTQDEEKVIYIHCVIGEKLTKEQLAEENQLDNRPQEVSTTPQTISFDRLLQQGFSQEDVDDLRRQFYSIYGGSTINRNRGGDDQIADVEEEERRQRRLQELEERWIESTYNTEATDAGTTPETRRPDTQGTDTAPPQPSLDDEVHVNEDILIGFLLGVFLGILSAVFLLVDDTVFNKRQRMALIGGLLVNCSLAIARGLWI
ncbi:Transmembrane protein [Spathaspora sp. JA1]|nr:Transmembrane protein [Spathaspora sp. JA1]